MIIYVWIFCLIFTGFLLLFGRIRWVETAKRLLSRTKKGMDQSARLRVLENRHKLQELQRNNLPGGRISLLLRYAAQISGVHPGEMDRRKSSGNDGDLWSVAWKQREIPGSFIGNNDMRSHGISVPEHTAGRRIAGDQ